MMASPNANNSAGGSGDTNQSRFCRKYDLHYLSGHFASPDQIGDHFLDPIIVRLQPMVLDHHVPAFDEADFGEATTKLGEKRVGGRPPAQISADGHRLLRAHQHRRAAAVSDQANLPNGITPHGRGLGRRKSRK